MTSPNTLNLSTRRVLFLQLGIVAGAMVIVLVVFGVLAHPYITRCVKTTSVTGLTYYCNTEEVVAWIMAIMAIILIFITAMSYLIYREVSKEKKDIANWEKAVKQRRFKVQRDKKFYIELLSRDSDSFKEVYGLVRATWDAVMQDTESGNSRDGVNLFHNKLRVKQIYEITNKTLLDKYKKCLVKDSKIEISPEPTIIKSDETKVQETEQNWTFSDQSNDTHEHISLDNDATETEETETDSAHAPAEVNKLDEPKLEKETKEKNTEPHSNITSYQFCNNYKSVQFPNNCQKSERYLFHGSLPDEVTNIVMHGFDTTRGVPGPFGKAVHLFESSEKADQLSDKKFSREDSDLLMILVRATLGRVYENNDSPRLQVPCEDEECDAMNCSHALKYDCAMVGYANSFRQAVVYDAERCYPHYVILYDRTYHRHTLSTML